MKPTIVVTLGIVLSITALTVEPAWACAPHEYEQCGPFGIGCVCVPKVGGTIGDAAEHAKGEIFAQTGGAPLEQWIIQSRDSAIGTAQPIPLQIRRQLTGYIEEDLLNRVRFKVGDNGILNLAGLTMSFGDAAAITLIDLVVFRNWNDALNDPAMWSHELTHVKQYRDWGTRNFAISYARRSSDVEDPAYAVGNGYHRWAARSAATYGGYWQQPSPGPRRGFDLQLPSTVRCFTSQGISAPFSGTLGEPCFMQVGWSRIPGISR
jgi:hypothetical protein